MNVIVERRFLSNQAADDAYFVFLFEIVKWLTKECRMVKFLEVKVTNGMLRTSKVQI